MLHKLHLHVHPQQSAWQEDMKDCKKRQIDSNHASPTNAAAQMVWLVPPDICQQSGLKKSTNLHLKLTLAKVSQSLKHRLLLQTQAFFKFACWTVLRKWKNMECALRIVILYGACTNFLLLLCPSLRPYMRPGSESQRIATANSQRRWQSKNMYRTLPSLCFTNTRCQTKSWKCLKPHLLFAEISSYCQTNSHLKLATQDRIIDHGWSASRLTCYKLHDKECVPTWNFIF